MKLMFCMFAEDVALLPEKLFHRVLHKHRHDPARLNDMFARLFAAMASGGDFGVDAILHFNGGLFNDLQGATAGSSSSASRAGATAGSSSSAIQLTPDEIQVLLEVNAYDWGSVEPSIFGTLFERTLDPAKRSQIGAHYTSKENILKLVEPVVMQRLRREWHAVRDQCDQLWPKIQEKARAGARTGKGRATTGTGVKIRRPGSTRLRAKQRVGTPC